MTDPQDPKSQDPKSQDPKSQGPKQILIGYLQAERDAVLWKL